MNRELQNKIQEDISKEILIKRDLIVYVSIRLGKTRIALKSIEKDEKILVVYPNTSIKKSWTTELEKFTPLSTNITFVTKASVHKYANTSWDYLILDELPMMQSEKQLEAIKSIKYKKRVALTGVMNNKTKKKLKEILNLNIGIEYTISKAIKDGLVKDYEVFIHFIPMNDNKLLNYKYFNSFRKAKERNIYDFYTEEMNKCTAILNSEEKCDIMKWTLIHKMYMGLRTNLLYNSESLTKKAKELIEQFKDEKLLIYTLRTEIADELSNESYHSKNKEEEILEAFKIAKKGHLAVVNSVSAGITIESLNKVLFHTYDSNTENFYQKLGRSLLFEFEEEKSAIHILCLQETQMEEWVNKACQSLDQDKINYIIEGITYKKLDYIKALYPDLELYLYNGSVVYYSHEEENGNWINKMYKFFNSDQAYSINPKNLIKI